MLKQGETKERQRDRVTERRRDREIMFSSHLSFPAVSKSLCRSVPLIFLALSFLAGCGGASDSNGEATLTLGAYTTPREAYSKAIIPEFRKHWKAKTGQEVGFQESYQGSGAQSRAITSGFEADIAALSLESDVTRIAEAGLIRRDWQANQYLGIVS